jgi:hypothetical protein
MCHSLDVLGPEGGTGLEACLLDPCFVLGHPRHELSDYELDAARQGRHFGIREVIDGEGRRRAPGEGEVVALVRDKMLMGVWETRGGRASCVANFPEGIRGVS